MRLQSSDVLESHFYLVGLICIGLFQIQFCLDISRFVFFAPLPEKIKMRKWTYELVLVAAITSKASSAIKELTGLTFNGGVPLHLEEIGSSSTADLDNGLLKGGKWEYKW